MQLGSVEVEIVDGYVVAAHDPEGGRWAACRRSSLPRLLSHALVMTAVAAPFMVTAAWAHPAAGPGRADTRGYVLPAEVAVERDHHAAAAEAIASLPTPSSSPTTSPPAPHPFAEQVPVAGGGGHFAFGWCTYYVSTRRFIPWAGNAIDWWPNAARMGFPEGSAPRVGAIMVTRESPYGHVAYVEAVDADGGGWTVTEMNYRGFGVVDTRHIRAGQVPLVGFIY